MVKLTKTPLPPNVSINSEQDYRNDEIFGILFSDCNGKCYICENKPATLNVEHLVPHRNDPKLKYCWENLFIACGHCNGTKSDTFDNIINPTKIDPEKHISLSVEISGDLIDSVAVMPHKEDESTMQTVNLLMLVYNGGSTAIKRAGSSNLRNAQLLPDVRLFYQYIENHRKEPDLGYSDMIREEINRAAKFAAFKRKIVYDNPQLRSEFAEDLE